MLACSVAQQQISGLNLGLLMLKACLDFLLASFGRPGTELPRFALALPLASYVTLGKSRYCLSLRFLLCKMGFLRALFYSSVLSLKKAGVGHQVLGSVSQRVLLTAGALGAGSRPRVSVRKSMAFALWAASCLYTEPETADESLTKPFGLLYPEPSRILGASANWS